MHALGLANYSCWAFAKKTVLSLLPNSLSKMFLHLAPKSRTLLLPLFRTRTTSPFHTSNENAISQSSPEEERRDLYNCKVEISHPWPEWIKLMEHLIQKGYFEGHPFGRQEMSTKDTNQIRTALLNFSRDRFDLIRCFSTKDISVVVGSGCPSLDRKVVNSGKRLRAHVGIGEGKVCSSCSLRGSCERAYVMARKDEGGRTVDVMRILLTYGLDPITGSVENTPCLNKSIEESVRRLLIKMVEFSDRELDSDLLKAVPSKRHPSLPEHSFQQLSGQINVPMKQGDWICPKCNFHNFAKNIKCLRCDGLCEERLRKLGEDQEHLPLKKGDWLCGRCNFLNFAKNTRCLQCKEKPPKRQLNPGEWECPSCNYINFRKNMLCLKCDWRRPKASNYSDISAQNQLAYESHNQPHGMNFVRDDVGYDGFPSTRVERQKESGRSWTSLEDDKDDDNIRLRWNRFEDFPTAGGHSDLSQNLLAREKWKEEMSKRSHSFSKESDDDNDNGNWHSQLPSDFVEATDDEEIAQWFRPTKID